MIWANETDAALISTLRFSEYLLPYSYSRLEQKAMHVKMKWLGCSPGNIQMNMYAVFGGNPQEKSL